MAKHAIVILGWLLLNSLSQAVSETDADKIAPVEDSPKLDDKPYGVAEKIQTTVETNSGSREKRFYNYFDYNFGYNLNSEFPFIQRGQSYKTDYGSIDPLEILLKKLQDLTNIAKQRAYLPPPAITRPTYIPFLYLARNDCPCSVNSQKPVISRPLLTNQPSPNDNNITPNSDNATDNKTVPQLPTRFPETDESRDTRDNNNYDYGDDSDGTRPISLKKPVKSNIPSPPLEHGSSQAGLEPSQTEQAGLLPPLALGQPSSSTLVPGTGSIAFSQMLSACESAAIFCCHKPRVTYECFTAQGCSNPNELAEPCDSQVILNAINKLQNLYNLMKTSTGS